MPKIPAPTGRQVGLRAVATPGFSQRAPDASGLTQGLAQAEHGMIQRIEQEREQAETTEVIRAKQQMDEWKLKTMFDPEAGVYTRKGSNALDVTNQTLGAYDQQSEQILNSVSNERVRARIKGLFASDRTSFNEELNRYEYGENKRYQNDTDDALIQTSLQGAALYYNQPDKVAFNQRQAAAVIQSKAQRNGWSPEQTNLELLKTNSSMSSAVIGRMANDDPYRAREYFNQAQGAMTAEDQVQIDRMIQREIKSREIETRQLQAIARGELTSKVQDATAAYLQGLDFARPPAEAEFVGAYGAADGRERYQEFLKVQSLGSAIRDLATADPAERDQIIDRFNPVTMQGDAIDLSQADGLIEQGNIDLNARPVVKNDDGSISTVRSMSVNFDGQEVLIPTVSDDGRVMSDEQAIQQYQETGRHLGKFESPEQATAYAERLHQQQEQQYAGGQRGVAREGFSRDIKLYGVLTNAAVSLTKELQGDPAGYALKYSPQLRQAASALANGDAGAGEAYAAASLAEQERLGVAQPKLLTNSQAAAIVEQFAATEDGGSNSAALITQLQDQWGKHWPTVFRQLQSDLPGAALVIGSGVDQATASTLARIAPIKTTELKKGLDSTETSAARDQLNDLMAEFRGTLMQQAGGERTFTTLYNEAERLALSNMLRGKGAKDAATEAFNALVDAKYTIKGSWRAPKTYDADTIERGAELVTEAIDPADLAFNVPAGTSEGFARARVKAAISKDGYWVTLPDESGLALYYGGAAVLDKSGRPISRTWDDLSGTAAATPSAWERFNEGRRQMNESRKQPVEPIMPSGAQ